jgi:tetratricopeptide (TPR) repeat protein
MNVLLMFLRFGNRFSFIFLIFSSFVIFSTAIKRIGIIYKLQGNYTEALKNYLAALKINEALGNKKAKSNNLINIGNIYNKLGIYDKALINHFAALKIREEISDKKGVALINNNIGNTYLYKGNYPEALKYYSASLKINEEAGDKLASSGGYNNIGKVYYLLGNKPEALKNYFSSLKLREEIKNKIGEAECYNNIGAVYLFERKIDSAASYINKALTLAKEIGNLSQINSCYNNLAALDSVQGNFNKALKDYKLFITTRDNLVNNENLKKTMQMQTDFLLAQKEAEHEKAKIEEKHRQEKEEEEKEATERLQMEGIALFITAFISMLLLVRKRKISPAVLRVLGTFSVLILFEFLNLLIDTRIESVAHHNIVITLLCSVALAAIIIPLHHKAEHWLKERLLKTITLQTSEGLKIEVIEDEELREDIKEENKHNS